MSPREDRARDPLSPERLASLFDGRLPAAERDILLGELSRSDQWSEVYADAIAAISSVEGEAQATAPRVHSDARWRWYRWAAAAAVIVAIGGLTLHWRSGSRDEVSVLLAEMRGRDHAEALSSPRWSESRGQSESATGIALAARAAVLTVDLEAALIAGDTVATSVAARLASLLGVVPGSGAIRSGLLQLERNGPGSPASLEMVRDVRRQIPGLVDADAFAVATWSEAVRLASIGTGGEASGGGGVPQNVRRAAANLRASPGVTDSAGALLRALADNASQARSSSALETLLNALVR